jgi:hypothetical protein
VCHYGHNPTILVFARTVGPELEDLVKRLDSPAGRLEGFRLGVCVILLTEDEPAAVKKLRALKDRTKVQRVSLACFASARPRGYDIARETEWTVLHYTKYKVTANRAVKKGDLGKKVVDRVIADIDRIVPPTHL